MTTKQERQIDLIRGCLVNLINNEKPMGLINTKICSIMKSVKISDNFYQDFLWILDGYTCTNECVFTGDEPFFDSEDEYEEPLAIDEIRSFLAKARQDIAGFNLSDDLLKGY